MNFNIDLIARFAQFQDSLEQVKKNTTKFTNDLSAGFSKVKGVLATLGIGAAGISLGAVARQMVAAVNEAEQASKKLEGTLKATGSAAGVTKREIDDLADSLAKSTQFDDESIRNAASELLVFRNVQRDVFTDTLKLSTDVAAAMGTSVPEAAAKLGRSLEDPETAFGLLRRQGVLLTEQQKDQIKSLGELGDKAGQQRLILDRLKQAYGGLAETLNTGVNKGLNDVKKSWNELLEAFGKSPGAQAPMVNFLGVISSALDRMKATLEGGTWFDRWRMLAAAGPGGALLAALEPLTRGKAPPSGVPALDDEDSALGAEMGARRQRQAQLDEASYVRERERAKKAKEEQDRAAKEAIKYAEQLLEKYQDKIRSINDEMRKSEGLDSPLLAMKSLIAGDKDFKGMSSARKTALLDATELLGITQALAQEDKERTEGLAQVASESAAWKSKDIADSVALRDKLLDLIDPLREIQRANAQIDEQVKTGWMTEAQGKLSKLDPAIRALLQPLDTIHEKIQKAWEAGRLTNEQMEQALKSLEQPLEKTNDIAKSLGLTFSSAFEDAVIGGKKFRDVLAGIGQDIARILLRKNVTEPLANAIGKFDFGGLIKGFLSGGGAATATGATLGLFESMSAGYATGTDYVPRTGYYKLHQGEKVTTAADNARGGGDVNIYQNIYNDSRSDQSSIRQGMAVATRQSVFAVEDANRRTRR